MSETGCGKVIRLFDNGDDAGQPFEEELLCGKTAPDGVSVYLCKECRA